MRYELRLRQRCMREVVGRTLRDLEAEAALGALRCEYQRAQFDASVGGLPALLDIMERSEESAARKVALLGALVYQFVGVNPGLSPRTQDLNRKAIRQLGLVPSDLVEMADGVRLDLEAGEEVRTPSCKVTPK